MILWKEPWGVCPAEREEALQRELAPLLGKDRWWHALRQRKFQVAGWTGSGDDWVIYVPHRRQFAHLYVGGPRTSDLYPFCEFFPSDSVACRFIGEWGQPREFQPIYDFTWASDAFLLAHLSIRIEALAERLGRGVMEWEEDQMGLQRGLMGKLPSGVVVCAQECDDSVRRLEAGWILVDACELAEHGAQPLLRQVCEAMGLTPADCPCLADEEALQAARELCRRAREARAEYKRKLERGESR